MKIELRPIGKVNSDFKKPEDLHFACEQGRFANTHSSIEIQPEFSECLKGIDKFSNLWVLYYLHHADRVENITYPGPKSIKNLEMVGSFASRSQYRPNHIALRLVSLLKLHKNIVMVNGLDAIDGTPVLDIKPYIPYFDYSKEPKIAQWYSWTDKTRK